MERLQKSIGIAQKALKENAMADEIYPGQRADDQRDEDVGASGIEDPDDEILPDEKEEQLAKDKEKKPVVKAELKTRAKTEEQQFHARFDSLLGA